jgi:deoxyribonuclease-4
MSLNLSEFIKDPVCHGRVLSDPPLVPRRDTYEIDFDHFERAITDQTKLFILCNPHNPVGRAYTRKELEKMAASQERIIQTARVTALFGGDSVVFHPAFYLKDEPSKVYATVKKNLEQIVAKLRAEGNRVSIRPEVMGRGSQFGTLEEVLQLSAEVDGVAPALDFAHWHARTGRANSYDEFTSILKRMERKLGRAALDNMHIHVSGIDYGPRVRGNTSCWQIPTSSTLNCWEP